jgi:nucleoside-diphosphate-sugar epimerase
VKVLVTGATGFLGGHLVDECARRGDQIRVLVRPGSDRNQLDTVAGLEYAVGDLSEPATLPAAVHDVDVVLHSAGLVRDFGATEQFRTANLVASENLVTAACAAGVARFVYVSSPSVVMTGRDQRDIDERTPYPRRFLNQYSASKAATEQMVLARHSPQFVTCAVRPRGIWGPRDRHGFLPRILSRLSRGTMPDLSGPDPVYASLCYCVNAARACRLAAESAPERIGGRSYFVADAEQSDVWALIRRVAEMFALPPPARRIPAPLRDTAATLLDAVWRLPLLADREPPVSRYTIALLTRTGTYNTGAARRDLGYAPVVDQETGLADLRRWVEQVGGVAALVRTTRG